MVIILKHISESSQRCGSLHANAEIFDVDSYDFLLFSNMSYAHEYFMWAGQNGYVPEKL